MAHDRLRTYLVTVPDGAPEKVQAVRPWITYGALVFCGPDEQLRINGKEVTPRPGEPLKVYAPGQWLRYERVYEPPDPEETF